MKLTKLMGACACMLAAFGSPSEAQIADSQFNASAARSGISPKADAPIDLTGYWVSIVNEDWRWRMVTPPKGDFASVPLNAAGKSKLNAWNPADDGSCKAFGAAGLMRMPTRLHITWAADNVLKIESDNGEQTRLLYFDPKQAPSTGKTAQGRSVAVWEHSQVPSGGMGFPSKLPQPPGGDLKVVTQDLTDGWLRRNGVPYSDGTRVTEFFDRFPTPDGNQWFVVTTQVDDPAYLVAPFVTSSHFRREADGSKWHPVPCKS